jgi:hypothetical protein
VTAPKLTENERASLEHAAKLGGFGIVDLCDDPMLASFLRRGFAASRWVGSGDGPPYLFYDITDAGLAALRGES